MDVSDIVRIGRAIVHMICYDTPMPITLTCTCGQQQNVAETLAGKTAACVRCGNALAVPAMGKLVGAKAKPAPPRKSASRLVPAFLIAGMATAALGALGFLAWAITYRHAQEPPTPIAQHKDPEQVEKPHIVPPERKRAEPEPENKLPPAVIEPVTKEPPKIVLQPVKPKEEPPPKLVVEPIKPKEPPPVIEKEKEKKPLNLIEPVKLVWNLKADEVFFQELLVTQKPTFTVQGLQVAAFLQYRIVSRFTVKKRNDDGSLIVEQKIESARLLQADDLSRPRAEPEVAKMPGTIYTLTFSPKMDVTKFEGGPGAAKGMQLAGGLGFQMASLLDRDGWKELNQSTFFQMNEPLKANARWSKPLTHNWGALGSWNGQTHYQYAGQEKDLHKITYGLQLAYKAPKAGAAGLMAVNGANFQAPVAGGYLVFDAAKGRVIAAEERFRVKGFINVNLLGQNTGVEIDEDQHFAIRIHEKLDGVK
jgi:hypothetical protein